MATFSKEELQKVLENHRHWLYNDCDGWESMRADLCGADLCEAENVPFVPMACPDSVAFIGWKKARIGEISCPGFCNGP